MLKREAESCQKLPRFPIRRRADSQLQTFTFPAPLPSSAFAQSTSHRRFGECEDLRLHTAASASHNGQDPGSQSVIRAGHPPATAVLMAPNRSFQLVKNLRKVGDVGNCFHENPVFLIGQLVIWMRSIASRFSKHFSWWFSTSTLIQTLSRS